MNTPPKVAIVTGAGTGIGKAVALALLDEGFAVVLAGRREALLAQTMADAGSLREGGPADFVLVHGDPLSDPSALWRVWRVSWAPDPIVV